MSQMSIHHRKCPHCGNLHFVKRGCFYKKSTKTYIPRYSCRSCGRNFSTRTNSRTFNQKKVHINDLLFKLFAGGVSIRESARIVGCTYKTAYLKYQWLGPLAKEVHQREKFESEEIQLDELLTIEHTKLKPLSVLLAVDEKLRIAGIQVAQIKAFGHLASVSLRKYGPRIDNSQEKLNDLLRQISSQNPNIKVIKTDKKVSYLEPIKKHFPNVSHLSFLGEEQKEKSREQKYLNTEKKKFDPLFNVNHICARLRDHTKRLARRNWCTTKKPEHLEFALYLYIAKTNGYNLFR